MKLVTINHLENGGLGQAVNLYISFLLRPGEREPLNSVVEKMVAEINKLPDGPLPSDQTITVEFTDEEAALLVRVIDVVTQRAEEMENVRAQLGGGDTTADENGDTETGEINVFDLLSSMYGEGDEDEELTEVTVTVAQSNMIAAANYAYASTYADIGDQVLFHEFGARCDGIIRALPHGADSATLLYTEDEGELIGRALHQMDLEGREVFVVAMADRAEELNAVLDSVMELFSVEKESHDVPTPGPDEGGPADGDDGLSTSGEPAGAGELSISES